MKEILIKKYDNRRLYCVEEAKYVSLTEIRDFLQRGDNVKVIEKSSGKNITKYVLMQVLLEDRYELLPTNFYQMILQSPKDGVEKFFKQFFPWMMDVYKNSQQGTVFPPTGLQNPWMQSNPFQLQNPFIPTANKSSTKTSKKNKTEESEGDQMSEILKRLRELEDKMHTD